MEKQHREKEFEPGGRVGQEPRVARSPNRQMCSEMVASLGWALGSEVGRGG